MGRKREGGGEARGRKKLKGRKFNHGEMKRNVEEGNYGGMERKKITEKYEAIKRIRANGIEGEDVKRQRMGGGIRRNRIRKKKHRHDVNNVN